MVKTVMSFNERFQLMQNAVCDSKEVAQRKFNTIVNARLSQVSTKPVIDLLEKYNPEKILPQDTTDAYYNMCLRIRLTQLATRFATGGAQTQFLLENIIGTKFVNSMVLLSLLFLNQAKYTDNEYQLHYALNMNLEDYWDAAIEQCKKTNGRYVKRNIEVLEDARAVSLAADKSKQSIKKTLANLLNSYLYHWKRIAVLDYILECDNKYSDMDDVFLEEKLSSFDLSVSDFDADNTKVIPIDVFTSVSDYSRETLLKTKNEIRNVFLRSKFSEKLDSKEILLDMMAINSAVQSMFQLIVLPIIGTKDISIT